MPVNTIPVVATLAATAFLVVRENTRTTDNDKKEAELALSEAYNLTQGYYASRRNGAVKDYEKEHQVASAWDRASILLRQFDNNLAHRLKLKSRFWREGEAWSEEQIRLANIGLEDVRREGTVVLRA
ncbi:MAG: hypothetical protein GY755_22240 [Chloroflexi bacterium]|nr:hypothetical protein [Chloroflexota bacterium]